MKYILFSLLIFQSFYLFAQYKGAYKKNDTLNVLSPNGIIMNDGSIGAFQKLVDIPYAGKVVVTDNFLRTKSYSVQEFEDFMIKGHWVKVKYEGKEGYVFDGYLSKLKAPDLNRLGDTIINGHPYSEMEKYLEENFKSTGKRKCKEFKSKVVYKIECDRLFENETTFHSEIENDIRKIYSIQWKNFNHTEAYWLAKIISIKGAYPQTYKFVKGDEKSGGFFGSSILTIGDQKKGGYNVIAIWGSDGVAILWGDEDTEE